MVLVLELGANILFFKLIQISSPVFYVGNVFDSCCCCLGIIRQQKCLLRSIFLCLYHFDWRLFVCKEITVLVAVLREEAIPK
jgi:hypothetical protein